MALSKSLNLIGAIGGGPRLHAWLKANFTVLNDRVPAYDPVADSGKVLKIVGNPGVPTWTTDAT